jgi:mono/diheme cytochrome c family protein
MVNYGRGTMPPLAGMLTNEQIRAVAAYVTTDLFK